MNHYRSISVARTYILILTFSLCYAVSAGRSSTLPIELEEREAETLHLSLEYDLARKMWNEAKQNYKEVQLKMDKVALQSTKRYDLPHSDPTNPPPELANSAGSKYMLELYQELSSNNKQKWTSSAANSITSLTFVKRYSKCPVA